MERQDALARLGHARVARMATVGPNGRPHVVPFVFALDGTTVYWTVDRKPKRSEHLARLEHIRANPHVELVADHYEEEWSMLWWVRAAGTARTLDQGPERDRALDLLATKYPQYPAQLPAGALIAIALNPWSACPPSTPPVSPI